MSGKLLFGFVLVALGFSQIVVGIDEKVCIGTNARLSVPSNLTHHYINLKNRYTNCTHLDGNLELTWLTSDYDLSFLRYLQEVTGYILISHMETQAISLPNLKIIRGRTLYKWSGIDHEFSLSITNSKTHLLELPELREISNGNVLLSDCPHLCHLTTINWNEIISDVNFQFLNQSPIDSTCAPCHKSCPAGCWGEGEINCQKFTKEFCSPQCKSGRCFGPNFRGCCHQTCAAGCTGPLPSDCIACRNFSDDGVCKEECPPLQTYDPVSFSWLPNPNGKYAYGTKCVKNCPQHLLIDNGACVKSCPSNKREINKECVPCTGACPKTCKGDVVVNSANIDRFKGCTFIEGSITILETSFTGYQQIFPNFTVGDRYDALPPSRLEIFSELKELTGFLNIQANHPEFKSLRYFRNLETIGGRSLTDNFSALYIIKTSLEALELRSLKRINFGAVSVLENEHLCFAADMNWSKLLQSSEQRLFVRYNANTSLCRDVGLTCDKQCNEDGCWGKGSDQCLGCQNVQAGRNCVQDCNAIEGFYRTLNDTCERCHQECRSCTGPGPNACVACKYFKDGPVCVSKCPGLKYENKGICVDCHAACVNGCTGPRSTLEMGGCNSCHRIIVAENVVANCLSKNDACPLGYYEETLPPVIAKFVCRKCHHRCKHCTAYGFHESVCQECMNYKHGEECEDECPVNYYVDPSGQECLPCDDECMGCSGTGPGNCLKCKNFRIYSNEVFELNEPFRCAWRCPPELPRSMLFTNTTEAYCVSDPKQLF